MIWALLALGLALEADWRRLALLAVMMAAPVPALLLVGAHWWRSRPDQSMRAPWFCDAVAAEIRAGSTVRLALETAARSVDATRIADLCSTDASMEEIAAAARVEFPGIGVELGALVARAQRLGVTPAALFDELGNLGLAQVEVAHEVAAATAPAKAASVVLLAVPMVALAVVTGRGDIDSYLAQPAQRAAALIGLSLTLVGLTLAVLMLRGSR